MATEYPTRPSVDETIDFNWAIAFPNYYALRRALGPKSLAYMQAEVFVICHLAKRLDVDRNVIDCWLAGTSSVDECREDEL